MRMLLLASAALTVAAPGFAQVSVSNLPAVSGPLTGTEIAPVIQGAGTKQTKIQQIANTKTSIGSGGTGATTAVAATAALEFKNTGSAAVAGSLATRLQAGYIYATDYMTAAQIADGISRTDSMDVSAALNHCIADALTKGKTCFLAGGKWKVSGAQLLVDYGPNINSGGSFIGEGAASTTIDLTANTANPPFLVIANGGTVRSPLSTTYGTIGNFALQGRVAGPVLQLGKADQSDQLNQMTFSNISIQNFNASSASTCGTLHSLYSSTFHSLNCSTAAGPNVANYQWVIDNTSFGTFTAFGGSNSGTALYLTGGTIAGNTFVSWDCELVTTCIKIDSPNAVDNVWHSGTWSYNWGKAAGYGVIETAGGDNAVYHPNLNVSSSGGATTFLSAGSNAYFGYVNNSTLISQTGNNNFTGTNSFYGATIFNKDFSALAGSHVARLKLTSQGTCAMISGSCGAQSLGPIYATAPICFLTWTGTGELSGVLKVTATTTTVTPGSSNRSDTAQVNWACFGN